MHEQIQLLGGPHHLAAFELGLGQHVRQPAAAHATERSASVDGRLRAVPPRFRLCAVLNSESASAVSVPVVAVNPLLNTPERPASPAARAETPSHFDYCASTS
jgi:hypothetical protein